MKSSLVLFRLACYAAFTLAEVLITLGIIGVVAALTIPTLMQNAQNQQIVSALKKAHSEFSQAYSLAVQANGMPDTWTVSSTEPACSIDIFNYLQPYLKITKVCGASNNCSIYNDGAWAHADLADGSGFAIYSYGTSVPQTFGTSPALKNVYAEILIDLNGLKKPNHNGKDQFLFYLTFYGIIPAGTQQEISKYYFDSCTSSGTVGCTAWVIYNENMDYLKCRSDLSWDGNLKCP